MLIWSDSIAKACAALSLFALAACAGPEPMFVKEGVSFRQYQRDTISCLTSSAQAVPANTQLGWQPYVGLYTADTNAQLRDAASDLCLREKGYSKVTLPLCESDIRMNGVYGPQTETDPNKKLHIGPGSCYYIGRDLRPQLYTPQ